MRIVVTGGSGRLGRSVVVALAARGHEVVNADLRQYGDADFFAVDLTLPGDCYQALAHGRAEIVVHLAALAEPLRHPEQALFAVNVTSTFNMFQAALDLEVSTVIYAGSPNPVGYGAPGGWIPDYLPIDEEHSLQPWHAYNLSKAMGEDIMRSFLRKANGRLRAFAVRPCFVISPPAWSGHELPEGGVSVRERLDNPELAAASLFNYVDARDAADLIALLVEHGDALPSGEVFYASAPDALARGPLCELIPRYYPGTERIAGSLTGTLPAFSTAKAQRMLGWTPRRSWRTEMTLPREGTLSTSKQSVRRS